MSQPPLDHPPFITDESDGVWKLTGPNSLHTAIQAHAAQSAAPRIVVSVEPDHPVTIRYAVIAFEFPDGVGTPDPEQAAADLTEYVAACLRSGDPTDMPDLPDTFDRERTRFSVSEAFYGDVIGGEDE